MKQTFLAATLVALSTFSYAQSKLVISQIYGGAGCGTLNCSTYKNDFIEIFNAGQVAVSLNNYSIQYAAATGTAWQVTPLTNVTLKPGQYYLIAQGAGANGTSAIPAPDASGVVAMSATAAKVALVSSTTALSGSCPSGPTVVDLAGYGGTASCREGVGVENNVLSPSTTTAAFRRGNGCTDTQVNSNDFVIATPSPRNTASPISKCAATVPVNLTDFKATEKEGVVTLEWKTASEQNAAYFEVQRSLNNGRSWQPAGRVAAVGNSSAMNAYRMLDTVPSGTVQYRLLQVDLDGRSKYSSIISLEVKGTKTFSFSPNPSSGVVNIRRMGSATGATDVQVIAPGGAVVYQRSHTGNNIAINVTHLPDGLYILQVGREKTKLLVRH